jgi:glycosyltransferase involved in cell wall biosynthesis
MAIPAFAPLITVSTTPRKPEDNHAGAYSPFATLFRNRIVRVMMVNLGYAPDEIGGAEVALRNLARRLVGRDYRVSVACLSSRGVDWEYNDDGVLVRFLAVHPMGNQLMNPQRKLPQKLLWQLLAEYRGWSRRKIAEFVVQQRPDVIHTHNLVGLSTSAWEIAWKLSIPIVHSLHGFQLLCPYGTMLRGDRTCARQCPSCRFVTTRHRWASALPDVVVANSAYTLKSHTGAGYFLRSRHYVIPNAPAAVGPRSAGSPASSLSDGPAERLPLRIGYLGRLLPYKGVELLLDALGLLPQDQWVAKIAGAGTADYERKLQDKARDQALRAEFLGWVPQDSFFPQVDVLVIPPMIAEPQGMGVLEAVSRGIPVIYSDHGGLGELAAATPGTMPFRANSADDLARVLRLLITTPATLADLRSSAVASSPLCIYERFLDGYAEVYAEAARLGVRRRVRSRNAHIDVASSDRASAEPGTLS